MLEHTIKKSMLENRPHWHGSYAVYHSTNIRVFHINRGSHSVASEHMIPKRVLISKLSRTHGTRIILVHVVATCHMASQRVLGYEALAAKVASELIIALVDDGIMLLQTACSRQLIATLETVIGFPPSLWTPLDQHIARIGPRRRNRNLKKKIKKPINNIYNI